jgi:hypothetical protein
MKQGFTEYALQRQQRRYHGTAGISQLNQGYGFRPAFMDTETGIVYGSCYADGRPAPMHLLEGLPDTLLLARAPGGRVTTVKDSVVAGFVRDGRFYTREKAAQIVAIEADTVRPHGTEDVSQPDDVIDGGEVVEFGLLAFQITATVLETGWLTLGLGWYLAYDYSTPRRWAKFWWGCNLSPINPFSRNEALVPFNSKRTKDKRRSGLKIIPAQ